MLRNTRMPTTAETPASAKKLRGYQNRSRQESKKLRTPATARKLARAGTSANPFYVSNSRDNSNSRTLGPPRDARISSSSGSIVSNSRESLNLTSRKISKDANNRRVANAVMNANDSKLVPNSIYDSNNRMLKTVEIPV
jgi:hypothetical protein